MSVVVVVVLIAGAILLGLLALGALVAIIVTSSRGGSAWRPTDHDPDVATKD